MLTKNVQDLVKSTSFAYRAQCTSNDVTLFDAFASFVDPHTAAPTLPRTRTRTLTRSLHLPLPLTRSRTLPLPLAPTLTLTLPLTLTLTAEP